MVHSSVCERAPASTFIVIFFSGINKSKVMTTLMLQKGTNNRKQNVLKSFTKVFEVRLSVSWNASLRVEHPA